MPFIVATKEHMSILEDILKVSAKHGETMVMNDSPLEFFCENGFFLLEENGHGFFWCRVLDPITMEVHATFKPEYRGGWVKRSAMEGIRKVFSELMVERLVTRCKDHHKYVVAFSQWLGFKQIGFSGDNIVLECSLDSFVMRDDDLALLAHEIDFPGLENASMEQARFAGFFVLCVRSGLVMKGLEKYNRMAVLLGWEPLLMISDSPMLFSVGTGQFSPISTTVEA